MEYASIGWPARTRAPRCGVRSTPSTPTGPDTGPGSVFTVTERVKGKDMGTTRYETAEYEPDRRVAHRSDNSFDLVFELEAQEDATLLTVIREYPEEEKGGLRRLAARGLTEETVKPLLDQELVRIDRALTGGAIPTAGGLQRLPREHDGRRGRRRPSSPSWPTATAWASGWARTPPSSTWTARAWAWTPATA